MQKIKGLHWQTCRESGAIEADADNVWFLHYPTENQLSDEQKINSSPAKKTIIDIWKSTLENTETGR